MISHLLSIPRWRCTLPQFMFEDALVRKRIWNGSCILDQDILGHMVAAAKVPGSDSKWMDAPVYKVCVGGDSSTALMMHDTTPFCGYGEMG